VDVGVWVSVKVGDIVYNLDPLSGWRLDPVHNCVHHDDMDQLLCVMEWHTEYVWPRLKPRPSESDHADWQLVPLSVKIPDG
jgi:hypothetical protein